MVLGPVKWGLKFTLFRKNLLRPIDLINKPMYSEINRILHILNSINYIHRSLI